MIIYDWQDIKIEIRDKRYYYTHVEMRSHKLSFQNPKIEVSILGLKLIDDFTGFAFLKGACQAFMRNKLNEKTYVTENNKGSINVSKRKKGSVNSLKLLVSNEDNQNEYFYDFQDVCMLDIAMGKVMNAYSITTMPDKKQYRYHEKGATQVL